MAPEAYPRRGEVWMTSIDAATGGEVQKTRLAVVISNDASNALLNRVQVVPVSSQTGRIYLSEAAVTLNGEKRKIMADQMTTASKQRLHRLIGRLGETDMTAVSRTIRQHLGI